ncbi:hypothetical protein GFS31_22770 [Leptolyngbya sp. BL0902]|nr:hypothetical protein GFS31_22770 [Leptolyngbya sp. BL0902]
MNEAMPGWRIPTVDLHPLARPKTQKARPSYQPLAIILPDS